MEAAICALRQGQIEIGVLQEMKLTGGIHTRCTSGYKVWLTQAENRHWGGISIIWREEAGWKVEGAMRFGTNVVSFTITTGRKIWNVFREYIPPSYQLAVHQVMQDLAYEPIRVDKLLVGDLKAYLAQPRYQQE